MSVSFLISAAEYDQWTKDWQHQQDNPEPYPFFGRGEATQMGTVFPFDSLKYLLSTTGIATVKIRFGLKQVEKQGFVFKLILFGADADNQTITPYFVSDQYASGPPVNLPTQAGGNVPPALVLEWEKSWYENAVAGKVGPQMFNFRNGFLQGYNYPVTDLTAAMGNFEKASNICLSYGLHEYYLPYQSPDEEPTTRYTFGVVLYASDGSPDSLTSGYYDLTAPCPHTC